MNMNDMPITTDVAAQEPMDDTELEAIIGQDLTDAVSYIDSDISPIRAMGTPTTVATRSGTRKTGAPRWWRWRCATLSAP